MLKITIELDSARGKEFDKTLGVIGIANDGGL
jgi:hypothetical protein